jgi:hypothetical protein
MLSPDELANGRVFILKLWDAAGVPRQWVETLSGAVARTWYDIYQRSDWGRLRIEADDVFRHGVSEEEAERVRRKTRCVFIQTRSVAADEIGSTRCGLAPVPPGWEIDGRADSPRTSLTHPGRSFVRQSEPATTALVKR